MPRRSKSGWWLDYKQLCCTVSCKISFEFHRKWISKHSIKLNCKWLWFALWRDQPKIFGKTWWEVQWMAAGLNLHEMSLSSNCFDFTYFEVYSNIFYYTPIFFKNVCSFKKKSLVQILLTHFEVTSLLYHCLFSYTYNRRLQWPTWLSLWAAVVLLPYFHFICISSITKAQQSGIQ